MLNILLHSLGIYLLSRLHSREVQEIYLINLSASEILGNVSELLTRRIPKLLTFTDATLNAVKNIQEFASIVNATLISITYYLAMAYITADKLLDIFLNIKYVIYWNKVRAKYLLLLTWVFSVSICLSTSLGYYFEGFAYKTQIRKFFMTPFDILFIALAVITYIFIFKKFHQTRAIPKPSFRSNVIRTRTCWYVFRYSRFFVSVLLILTFVLFMVVPDLILLFWEMVDNGEHTSALRDFTMILYQFSYLSDALIYLFMHRPITLYLWKKMRARRERCNIQSSLNKSRQKPGLTIRRTHENICADKNIEISKL